MPCTGSIYLNFTMRDVVFSTISGMTQSVFSPVPEPVTCAHHLRMWHEQDNKPLSVYRGGARTEEPVCYLTGKFVTLCEDVQPGAERLLFRKRRSRKGNSPPLGSCPRKKEEGKKEKKEGCCLTDTNTALFL